MTTMPTDGVEYVEFTDPVSGTVYRFNTTFFLSRYNCTWGNGCKGCDNTANHGCCNIGAHIADDTEKNYVDAQIARLTPDLWHRYNQDVWEETDDDDSPYKTRVVDGACVMLNPEDHEFPGCALHVGALTVGEDFRDWKPETCWLYPIRATPDGDAWLIGPVWRSEQWSSEHIGWWCIDDTDNYHPNNSAAFNFFEQEIRRMTSDHVWEMFYEWCIARYGLRGGISNYGAPIGGKNGRVHSVPVTLTRKG